MSNSLGNLASKWKTRKSCHGSETEATMKILQLKNGLDSPSVAAAINFDKYGTVGWLELIEVGCTYDTPTHNG
uniref:Uncharacterized protein n=1 Tax=Amphimedon queenslandica TaxID=400682 RepID=A0A1X7UV76_AMPQE